MIEFRSTTLPGHNPLAQVPWLIYNVRQNMDNFWSVAGKITGLISAVAGIPKIFEWINGFRKPLHFEYRFNDFVLPEGFRESFDKIKDEALKPEMALFRDSWLHRTELLSGEISDVGSQTLEDVEIRVDGAILWQVAEGEPSPKLLISKGSYTLGKLKAKQKITILRGVLTFIGIKIRIALWFPILGAWRRQRSIALLARWVIILVSIGSFYLLYLLLSR